jgi:hypothetical protein
VVAIGTVVARGTDTTVVIGAGREGTTVVATGGGGGRVVVVVVGAMVVVASGGTASTVPIVDPSRVVIVDVPTASARVPVDQLALTAQKAKLNRARVSRAAWWGRPNLNRSA